MLKINGTRYVSERERENVCEMERERESVCVRCRERESEKLCEGERGGGGEESCKDVFNFSWF